MNALPRRAVRWADGVILLATIALACAILPWADREYLRVQPPSQPHRQMEHPYRRFEHDWLWMSVVATFGVAGMLALDGRTWHRRGLSRPGTIVVFVALVGVVVAMAQQILVVSSSSGPNGLCYSLLNALEFRMPGAILGVWVVTWLRPGRGRPDWRERVARGLGWIWMANVGLLIGYGLLFR